MAAPRSSTTTCPNVLKGFVLQSLDSKLEVVTGLSTLWTFEMSMLCSTLKQTTVSVKPK